MATLLKVSSVNQITLPKALREKLGIGPGDEVEVEVRKEGLMLRKTKTLAEQIDDLIAELDRINKEHEKHMTPEQKKIAEMTKGWTVSQYHEYFDNTPEHKAYLKEKYGV